MRDSGRAAARSASRRQRCSHSGGSFCGASGGGGEYASGSYFATQTYQPAVGRRRRSHRPLPEDVLRDFGGSEARRLNGGIASTSPRSRRRPVRGCRECHPPRCRCRSSPCSHSGGGIAPTRARCNARCNRKDGSRGSNNNASNSSLNGSSGSRMRDGRACEAERARSAGARE